MISRQFIIHYHIYKNAGTSIDAMLKACFGERWGVIEGATPLDMMSCERVEDALSGHPDWCAISSHLARPPVPPGGLAIIFLRHPILRARSVYSYARLDHMQPDHRAAVTSGFPGYIEWALDAGRAISPIFDYQTYHLSRASFRGPYGVASAPTEVDLHEAENLLQSVGVCGVVEKFERSCERLEAAYRPFLPEFRLPGAHENRTGTELTTTEAARLTQIEEELGPVLYEKLLTLNALDIRLHATALRILQGI